MKNLIAAIVVCVALATTSFDADAAKRHLLAARSDSCSGGTLS